MTFSSSTSASKRAVHPARTKSRKVHRARLSAPRNPFIKPPGMVELRFSPRTLRANRDFFQFFQRCYPSTCEYLSPKVTCIHPENSEKNGGLHSYGCKSIDASIVSICPVLARFRAVSARFRTTPRRFYSASSCPARLIPFFPVNLRMLGQKFRFSIGPCLMYEWCGRA